jgi:hypothetical protein
LSAPPNFLSLLTGSFATPAAENPTVAMVEAAYRHHDVDARYINCDVAPEGLGGHWTGWTLTRPSCGERWRRSTACPEPGAANQAPQLPPERSRAGCVAEFMPGVTTRP